MTMAVGAAAVLVVAVPAMILLFQPILRLDLKRDGLFLFFLLEAWVYLFVAPTVHVREYAEGRQWLSFQLQVMCFTMFITPAVLTYANRAHRVAGVDDWTLTERLDANALSTLAIGVAFCAICLGGFAIAFQRGLLIRRVGPTLPLVLAQLSSLEFLVYRTFDYYAIFFVAILYFAKDAPRGVMMRLALQLTFAVCAISYFAYSFINTRLGSLLGVALLVCFRFLKEPSAARVRRVTLTYGPIAVLFGLWSIRVVENVRDDPLGASSIVSYLNPFRERVGPNDTPLSERLDGLDFMVEFTPEARKQGYAKGAAWEIPFIVTFGQVFAPDRAQAMKEDFVTQAENFFLANYTTIWNPTLDVISCYVTDLYGNFGPVGLLFAGLTAGLTFAWILRVLRHTRSSFMMAFAILVLTRMLSFETEFSSIVLGLFKAAPVLILVLVIPPFRLATNSEPVLAPT
jgi:hypothetical protein